MVPFALFLKYSSGLLLGAALYLFIRVIVTGFFTVQQNERAVKLSFGRAQRTGGGAPVARPRAGATTPGGEEVNPYRYPRLNAYRPGGPYFKWPWERVVKTSIATQTINMARDLETPSANRNGTILEAVTKDQLNTGLTGQIRYRVSEKNLYAYLFGVKSPLLHVMGFFVAILRERISNFEAPPPVGEEPLELAVATAGVSINDLRKNLRDLNEHMSHECKESERRYGIVLDASLITGIDPPPEVESALAAINTAHNHVSSEISLAQASADQKIVQSKRAVEIETLNAQAEVEPLMALAKQLSMLRHSGRDALSAYLRNTRLDLYSKTDHVVMNWKEV